MIRLQPNNAPWIPECTPVKAANLIKTLADLVLDYSAVEWQNDGDGTDNSECPCCGTHAYGGMPNQHADDCEIAVVMLSIGMAEKISND